MAAPLGAEKRSSMSEFTTQQKLGSGSYGNVFKVLRKADGQLCVNAGRVPRSSPLSRSARAGPRGAPRPRTARQSVLHPLPVPTSARSYAIKEVNIRKLQPRER
jgi:hypothetical protein